MLLKPQNTQILSIGFENNVPDNVGVINEDNTKQTNGGNKND